jgi:hypothetical protein
LHFAFGLLSTTVLRVLRIQTLEDNSVVKDSTSSCSKLGLGDAILHPHHSTAATGTITHPGEQQGVTLGGFPARGRTIDEGRFDPRV